MKKLFVLTLAIALLTPAVAFACPRNYAPFYRTIKTVPPRLRTPSPVYHIG